MNYKSFVKSTLTPTGVPVEFQAYTGAAATYITYFCYNEQGEEWAENEEIATGYYIQVDIWSKSNYTALENQIKTLMLTAGFKRSYARDLYENDTGIYHKAMRFIYLSENT